MRVVLQISLLEQCLRILYHRSDLIFDVGEDICIRASEYLRGLCPWSDVEQSLLLCGWETKGDFENVPVKERGQLISRSLYLLESFVADAMSIMVTSLDRIPDGWILKPELSDSIKLLSLQYLGAVHKERIDPEFIPDGYFAHSLLKKSIACFTDFKFSHNASLNSVIRALRSGASIAGGDVLLSPRFSGIKRSALTLQVLQYEGRARNRLRELRDALEFLIAGLNAAVWQVDSRGCLDIFKLDDHFSTLYLHLCSLADSMYLDTSVIKYEKQQLNNGAWEVSSSSRGGREIDRREWFDLNSGIRNVSGLSPTNNVRIIRQSVPSSNKVLQALGRMSQ